MINEAALKFFILIFAGCSCCGPLLRDFMAYKDYIHLISLGSRNVESERMTSLNREQELSF